MRREILLNDAWEFTIKDQKEVVNLPHSWNGKDGQDGGNDYLRDVGTYRKVFKRPEMKEDEVLSIQFDGANSVCDVILNGVQLGHHEGGYSRFIFDVKEPLQEENELIVKVGGRVKKL